MDVKLLAAIVLGFLPGWEPRYLLLAAYGAMGDAALWLALLEVPVLAALLTILVDRLWTVFERLAEKFELIHRLYVYVNSRRRRVAARLRSSWTLLGLIGFVAVPLPATGMYTGAAVALLIDVKGAKLYTALLAGGTVSVLLVYLGVKGIVALGSIVQGFGASTLIP